MEGTFAKEKVKRKAAVVGLKKSEKRIKLKVLQARFLLIGV